MSRGCATYLVAIVFSMCLAVPVGGAERWIELDFADPAAGHDFSSTAKDPLIELSHTQLRPGERWIEGFAVVPLDHASIRLTLTADAGNSATQVIEEKFSGRRGYFRVNVRDLPGAGGILRVEILDGPNTLTKKTFVLTSRAQMPLAMGTRIPIKFDVPPWIGRNPVAVTFGVPFAAGALWDSSSIRLMDANGVVAPCQIENVATWYPGGSIRWVRVDAVVHPAKSWFIVLDERLHSQLPEDLVRVEQHPDGLIWLSRGSLRYVLGPAKSPIQRIELNESSQRPSAPAGFT